MMIPPLPMPARELPLPARGRRGKAREADPGNYMCDGLTENGFEAWATAFAATSLWSGGEKANVHNLVRQPRVQARNGQWPAHHAPQLVAAVQI